VSLSIYVFPVSRSVAGNLRFDRHLRHSYQINLRL
jgi:hypothetical protein